MYFGCMKNWWLCSSLFWFQDETLQISIHHSNVIGQGDICYVFDKWSLNSLKYKIYFVDVNLQLKFSKYCMFTTKFWEVLYHLKLDFQHQICMGFFLLTKRNKRFSLRNILVLSQAYQHLEALNWRRFTSSFNRSMCSMFNKHINFSIAYHSSYWGFVICITFHVMLN